MVNVSHNTAVEDSISVEKNENNFHKDLVLVTESVEELCLLIEEAGTRRVLDCTCLKSVVGTE